MNLSKEILFTQSLFGSISRFNTYFLEFHFVRLISKLYKVELQDPEISKELRRKILKEIFEAFVWDAQNIKRGAYQDDEKAFPLLEISHWETLSKMILDYPSVLKRRKKRETALNKEDYPDYFNRSFHFQTDGYTSKKSAELYEHQVEVLFNGTANLMRKLLLTGIKRHYSNKKAKVLEVATGTGVASRLLSQNRPSFDIIATDLSREYIEFAKENPQNDLSNLRFEVEDASELSFDDNIFDISFQVFLLHELPRKEREKSIQEQIRVIKPGGLAIVIESLQMADRPEWEAIFRSFPKHYHEPFYMDYSRNPIEKFIESQDVEILETQKLLFSKCLILRKK